MEAEVWRTVVPVDDRWHTIELTGPIVHVGTRGEDYVEIWYVERIDLAPRNLTVRVFGTGYELGKIGKHVGTAVTPSGRFVWHLFEDGAR